MSLTDSKDFTNFFLCVPSGGIHGYYFANFIRTKFGTSMLFSRACSAFFEFIFFVLLACCIEDMTWIDASTIVTMMAGFVFWHYSVMEHKRNTVGVSSSLELASISNPTIAFNGCCRPHPTLAQVRHVWRDWAILVDFGKETLRKCFAKSLLSQKLGSNVRVHGSSLVCSVPRSRQSNGCARALSFMPSNPLFSKEKL